MGSHFGFRVGSLLLLVFAAGACFREHFTLNYASARVVIRELRPGTLMIKGRSIHSGACVDEVLQERLRSGVRLVVKMGPISGRCPGEFYAIVPIDPSVRTISLGVPDSANPQEYGVIWSRSPGPRIYCPPVCSDSPWATTK